MGDGYLWPARNVAEYAYCPRLFYLMEVEGIFLPSSDTEKGIAIHRRVDRPSITKEQKDESETDPERPKTIRSLVLTNEELGLTATLDLAHVSGTVVIPVEYRKGRPKHTPVSRSIEDCEELDQPPLSHPVPWPTDRIQIGLQSLLLESAGYTVSEAIIYYADEKLRLKVVVDEALKAESLQVLENAKQCAKGPRPLPLVNDPRCPRCSLQPLCLPDEINYQRADLSNEELTPRKIWPLHEDGIHIVAQQEGVKMGVRGMELIVTSREGNLVKTIPLADVESISLLGSVQITTQAIHAIVERNIPISFLSSAGRLVAMIEPVTSVSAELRRMQVRKLDHKEHCVELARSLIVAKIINQRTLLLRNHNALPSEVSAKMMHLIEDVKNSESLDSIRGYEGRAAALYFEHFPGMLKEPFSSEFSSHGRQRRPPVDPVNACLSFAYTMLMQCSLSSLRSAGLEPSIGAYHVSRPGRPALALDLMEPFRPLIADSVTISCFNRGELTEGHFLRTASGCLFTDAGRKAFFNAFGRRMDTEVTHPVFEYRLSYRRMLVLHARMIAAWLMGEVPTLAFLTTR